MDDFVATAESQQHLDLSRLAPTQPFRIATRISGQAASHLDTSRIAHDHRIPAFEPANHPGNARRQQALAAAKCRGRAGIDGERALGLERTGNPFLA